MNTYLYNSSDKVLEVTHVDSKTLDDIEEVINLGKPQTVIDTFIGLYLPTIDPAQILADDWHKQHQLVQTLDKVAPRKDIFDSKGIVTGKQPNAYDIAITARKSLESANAWLKGLRGLNSPLRPVFFIDVAKFKIDNAIDIQLFKQSRAQKVDDIKIDVVIGTKTVSLDGDETSQNRLARAGLGMMAAKIFALEMALRTSTTTSAATLKAELVAALDSPQVDIKIPWVAADNSLTELDSKAAITALTKAGQAQAAAWMK